MSGIFISYRRQDSQGSAGRLADTLKAQFAHNQIFRDIETIEPGVDFVEAIERALGSCVVLLAVIGPRWLSATDKNGRRRLDDTNDYTRVEIAAALQRKVRVIPVLVDGAAMPDAEELPDDLKTLARRQASELSDKRWDFDVRQLVQTIEKIPGIEKRSEAQLGAASASAANVTPAPSSKAGLWAGVAALVIIGIALAAWLGRGEEAAIVSSPPVAPPSQQHDARAGDGGETKSSPATREPVVAKRAAEPTLADVPPVQERPKYIDISGYWTDANGFRYTLTQQDSSVDIRMMANPQGLTAGGLGMLSGRKITMDYGFIVPNRGYSLGKANVEVSADGHMIQGTYIENTSGVTLPFLLRR